MLLDLKKLKRSGKDSEDFLFEYTPGEGLLDLPNAKVENPVKISGTVFLTGEHSAYIDCEVDYFIAGECTRCLEETKNEYIVEIKEGLEQNNPDGYSVKNDTIDLAKIVDDAIAMNSPVNFLCREDCKGICLACGKNLNDGECTCKNK